MRRRGTSGGRTGRSVRKRYVADSRGGENAPAALTFSPEPPPPSAERSRPRSLLLLFQEATIVRLFACGMLLCAMRALVYGANLDSNDPRLSNSVDLE
jgi:hypothetical protein